MRGSSSEWISSYAGVDRQRRAEVDEIAVEVDVVLVDAAQVREAIRIERVQHEHRHAGAVDLGPRTSSSSQQRRPGSPSRRILRRRACPRSAAAGPAPRRRRACARSIDNSSPSAPRSVGCTCAKRPAPRRLARPTKLGARFGVACGEIARPDSSRRVPSRSAAAPPRPARRDSRRRAGSPRR